MSERPLKVLVIEDDAMLRGAIIEALGRDKQISTCEASGLIEGARLARTERQLVALVDLGLEDASGTEAVEVLVRTLPGAAIAVITGASGEVREACRAAGAHKVIEKGSTESYGDGLISSIHEAVASRDAQLLCAIPKARIEKIDAMVDRILEKQKTKPPD